MLKLQGIMRAAILIVLLFLCHPYAHAYQFVFNNGKSIEGTILYEDGSIYRIQDSSGIEMRIRKSQLNLTATQSANISTGMVVPEPTIETEESPAQQRPVRVYTNADVRSGNRIPSAPSDPKSETAWRAHISKLEREFARLQGACRAAGGGPNFSKILRTHTYRVNGKTVRVTGYWADPVNIEAAKDICRRALQTEEALQNAQKQFTNLQEEKASHGR